MRLQFAMRDDLDLRRPNCDRTSYSAQDTKGIREVLYDSGEANKFSGDLREKIERMTEEVRPYVQKYHSFAKFPVQCLFETCSSCLRAGNRR